MYANTRRNLSKELRNLEFVELSMQTAPIRATDRRSGRSFTEGIREGQFDELCRRNGGPLAQRECSNNSLGVHHRDTTSAGFKFVGTWCQVMSFVISWIIAILFDTKTLNSLGNSRIHANSIGESDQQWKVQSKSMASLVLTISSGNKSAAESSNLGIVKAFNRATLDLAQSKWTFDSPLVSYHKYRHAPASQNPCNSTEALGCSTNRWNFKFCTTDNPHDERMGSGSASSQSTFALHRDCRNIIDFVIIGVIKPSGS